MTLIDTVFYQLCLVFGHYSLLFVTTSLLFVHSRKLFRILPGLLLVCANMNVSNQLEIFGLVFLGGAPYVVFASVALFLIQEIEGTISVLNSMLVALFLQVFFLLYSELHLAYIPSGNDTMHGFFETLFSVNGWVTLSSLFAFLSSHMLGVMLFWFIREKSKVSIGVSIFAATSITHILDTITFRLLLGCASLFEIPHFSSFLYQTVDMIIFKSAIAFITGMLISGYLFLSRGRL